MYFQVPTVLPKHANTAKGDKKKMQKNIQTRLSGVPVWLFWIAVLMVSNLSLIAQDDWNQWRGPNRTGVVKGLQLPQKLSADTLQTVWTTDHGPSYSGPIVADGMVFTTETRDRKHEVVTAYKMDTGKSLWQTRWEGAMAVPFFAKANGDWIRSTPAYADGRLFVAGMRDLLVCLDARTGEIQWKKDFVKEFNTALPSFGYVSSPLIHEGSVYVQAGASICRLDVQTGDVIWRAAKDGGGMFGSAFASPTVEEIHGTLQLVVQTRASLCGISVESGEVLWKQDVPAFRGMNIVTPCRHENGFFTSSYGGGSFFFDIKLENGKYVSVERWRNTIQGYMSTPVIIDGYAYMHLRNRRIVCMELQTGDVMWTSTPQGEYWSMVTNGRQILALDSKGVLLLVTANPAKFDVVDKREVTREAAWAHLAVINGSVFIRDLKRLSRLSWKVTQN